MTRIVAGSVGGRVLQVPRSGTRPTSERVREALFSRLEHLGAVADARVLDLFAGSGALGLEAVSRGAREVTLVEVAKSAADVCRRNATALGLGDRVVVVADRAERFVVRSVDNTVDHSVDDPADPTARPSAAAWDLVLVDPPYDLADDVLATVLAGLAPALAPGAVVVVERSTRAPEPTWPEGVERFDQRTYGDTAVWFAEPTPAVGG
jgi:16S rRNA (guanine966-N2)-methyltransferase